MRTGGTPVPRFTAPFIILEINLPRTDGFEVRREMRAVSDLCIIVVSVRSDEKNKSRAVEAGAGHYVLKPFNVQELLERIRAHLARRCRLRAYIER